jgi:NAD(P)-dependent dehydrogenase (short-subunit alcohol dehydrogenase family)
MGMVSREEYERRARTIPLRRIGSEEDNAHAIAFLLSPEAAFIHGEVLNVDGGIAACGD